MEKRIEVRTIESCRECKHGSVRMDTWGGPMFVFRKECDLSGRKINPGKSSAIPRSCPLPKPN